MCSAIASRSAGSRSAKRTSRSYFACSCRARYSGWYRYWRRPAASTPTACSFAFARGEIQTSRQAGGMTSASIRASFAGSVIRFPRESSYRNAPLRPRRRQPPVLGMDADIAAAAHS